MECPFVTMEEVKNRLCVRCKNFICKYTYGYAHEDPSYIEIYCKIFVEDELKTLSGTKSKRYKWNMTNEIGWNTDNFRRKIIVAKDCGFYEEVDLK